MERNTTLTFLMTDTLKNFEGEKCFMSYEFDQYASWLPECNGIYPAIREPERLDYNPAPVHILFDGGESPHSIINPPRQEIEPWSEQNRELRLVIHWHPTTPAFLRAAFNEAKKLRGSIRTVAAFVMRGLGDSQSIRVLISMGFTKDETRGTGQGVCYVRDMKNSKQEPKPPKPEPKPEPKSLDWCERELQITTDAIESRRALGVHETFLTGLLETQADQQKMVDERAAVKQSPEYLELCRQEREIQEQLDALKRGTCQP
jgi:hypothetical protein